MADNSLWPVIVGGLIAMGGVLITNVSTFFLSFRQASLERKKRRAEKFEELVTSVYAYDHWLETRFNINVLGKDETIDASPFARLEATSALYFPSYMFQIKNLKDTSYAFIRWTEDARIKRIHNTPITNIEIDDGMTKLYKPYSGQRDVFLTLITADIEPILGRRRRKHFGERGI